MASADIVGESRGSWLCVAVVLAPAKGLSRFRFRCNNCGTEREGFAHAFHDRERCHGCIRGERAVAHAAQLLRSSKNPCYRAWEGMLARCHDPRHKSFKDYGARGIVVCSEWRDSFEAFRAHIGPRPAGLQLDRIQNDRGYEPGNVRWTTCEKNLANRRNTVYVVFNGERRALSELARELGIPYGTAIQRHYAGWDVDRILGRASA